MYCNIAEQVFKKRMTDIEYIKYLEHAINNIGSRLNYIVSEFERDLRDNDGNNIKKIYLDHKGCLTDYPF